MRKEGTVPQYEEYKTSRINRQTCAGHILLQSRIRNPQCQKCRETAPLTGFPDSLRKQIFPKGQLHNIAAEAPFEIHDLRPHHGRRHQRFCHQVQIRLLRIRENNQDHKGRHQNQPIGMRISCRKLNYICHQTQIDGYAGTIILFPSLICIAENQKSHLCKNVDEQSPKGHRSMYKQCIIDWLRHIRSLAAPGKRTSGHQLCPPIGNRNPEEYHRKDDTECLYENPADPLFIHKYKRRINQQREILQGSCQRKPDGKPLLISLQIGLQSQHHERHGNDIVLSQHRNSCHSKGRREKQHFSAVSHLRQTIPTAIHYQLDHTAKGLLEQQQPEQQHGLHPHQTQDRMIDINSGALLYHP